MARALTRQWTSNDCAVARAGSQVLPQVVEQGAEVVDRAVVLGVVRRVVVHGDRGAEIGESRRDREADPAPPAHPCHQDGSSPEPPAAVDLCALVAHGHHRARRDDPSTAPEPCQPETCRQASLWRADPAIGPVSDIPPSASQVAPVT